MICYTLRFLVYARAGEYHADCIDAGAIGVGGSAWAAVADLGEALITMARVARDEDLQLLVEADPVDVKVFRELSSGGQSKNIVSWGTLTVQVHDDRDGEGADVRELHYTAGAA